MPEEIFVLSLMSIAAGTFLVVYVVSQIASYARSKRDGSGDSNALRASELESMLRDVVRQELERQRDAGGADEGEHAGFLDEHLDPEEWPDVRASSRARRRRAE